MSKAAAARAEAGRPTIRLSLKLGSAVLANILGKLHEPAGRLPKEANRARSTGLDAVGKENEETRQVSVAQPVAHGYRAPDIELRSRHV